MEDVKKEAISEYFEFQKKEAKRAFQQQVSSLLADISTLSSRLTEAKKRLMNLEYKEPEKVDL